MSVTLQSFSLLNPNPSSCGLKKSPSSSSSLRFGQLIAARGHGASPIALPKGLSGASLSLHRRSLWTRPIVAAAASQEESQHSDIEVENEKNNAKSESEESEEAWQQTLASFKEQALKMQSISQEAYEQYSKKALVIMKETSELLKIQADKARDDLSEIAKEISEEGKEYISKAAKNSPEPVKMVMRLPLKHCNVRVNIKLTTNNTIVTYRILGHKLSVSALTFLKILIACCRWQAPTIGIRCSSRGQGRAWSETKEGRNCHLSRIVTLEQVPRWFASGDYSFQVLGHEHKCFYFCLTFDMFAGDRKFGETL